MVFSKPPVYIRVKDGWDIAEVAGNINLTVDGVEAVRTRSMITGTADRLSAISGGINAARIAVWVLAAVIMTAAFSVLAGVRRKEFAVLRTIGFSRRQLGAEVLSESGKWAYIEYNGNKNERKSKNCCREA